MSCESLSGKATDKAAPNTKAMAATENFITEPNISNWREVQDASDAGCSGYGRKRSSVCAADKKRSYVGARPSIYKKPPGRVTPGLFLGLRAKKNLSYNFLQDLKPRTRSNIPLLPA